MSEENEIEWGNIDNVLKCYFEHIYDRYNTYSNTDFNKMKCVQLKRLLDYFGLTYKGMRKVQLINLLIKAFSSDDPEYLNARTTLITKTEQKHAQYIAAVQEEAQIKKKEEEEKNRTPDEYHQMVDDLFSNDILKFHIIMRLRDERFGTDKCEVCLGLGGKLKERGLDGYECYTCDNKHYCNENCPQYCPYGFSSDIEDDY